MKTLIVVDMQKDFVNGSLGSKEAVAIVPRVKAKIAEYVNAGNEVVFTRDTHYEDYLGTNEGRHLPVKHCIRGTDGWNIVSELLEPVEGYMGCSFVDKETFGWTGWKDRSFDEIELVGLCTDICVVSNALILKALFPEIDISVDARCCAGVSPYSHDAALNTMKMCQINVVEE